MKTAEREQLGAVKDLEYRYFNASPDRKRLSLVRITFSAGEGEGGIPAFYNLETGEMMELGEEYGTWDWDAQWFYDSKKIMPNE